MGNAHLQQDTNDKFPDEVREALIKEFEEVFREIIEYLRNAPLPIEPQGILPHYHEILRSLAIQFKVVVASIAYSSVEMNHWSTPRKREAKELFLSAMLEVGLCSIHWDSPANKRSDKRKSHS